MKTEEILIETNKNLVTLCTVLKEMSGAMYSIQGAVEINKQYATINKVVDATEKLIQAINSQSK